MCSIVGMQKRYIINLSNEERVSLQAGACVSWVFQREDYAKCLGKKYA